MSPCTKFPETLLPEPKGLAQVIKDYLETYFLTHGDISPPPGLYARVFHEVEKPLLQTVMKATAGNQKKAAAILGINRNTLRKKLGEYAIDKTQG